MLTSVTVRLWIWLSDCRLNAPRSRHLISSTLLGVVVAENLILQFLVEVVKIVPINEDLPPIFPCFTLLQMNAWILFSSENVRRYTLNKMGPIRTLFRKHDTRQVQEFNGIEDLERDMIQCQNNKVNSNTCKDKQVMTTGGLPKGRIIYVASA